MASRHWIFLLKPVYVLALAALLQGCSFLRTEEPAYSETEPVIEPELERRTITEADIDSEDFEVGAFVGVMSVEDFGTNFVYGARVAYHVTEDIFTEAAIGRTDTDETSFEKLSGGAKVLSNNDRKLTYYNISLGWNILPGEVFIGRGHAFNSALFLIGGVGNTDFADDNHFTINVGAGYRLLLNDWIALRIDVRDHTYNSDLLGDDERKHNLEATGGVSIFF
jgi:outer membrane beta-barrel protein